MWRFKPFTHRETASLEGRSIDVGNIKVHVKNLIAEGGFSCVYLARDALHSSRLYGLKHIVCNDGESLELVMKEITIMKLLNGHPNIIKLFSYAIMDMGRTKEALLVMEFCERSLVTFLENGAHFLEEKHVLLIFRDVCTAVFAMHNQNPPIAHRDLKAENVLLGADGAWKLCDFGSTSSNHKSFTKPEEMGIEEDNIRKHTTPAYRAPEMWDLYRRDVISEKVDIWALGCLLYRICFLKSAFDGESKLQITNVNYYIPELPKYSAAMIGLIKDMFQGSPDTRPDITQVWFRVNQLLPMEFQKDLPDSSSLTKVMCPHTATLHQEGFPKGADMMLQIRTPSASNEYIQRITASKQQPKPPRSAAKANGGGVQIGSFWSTQLAQNSQVIPDNAPPNGRGHEITVSPEEKQHIAQKTKLSHNEIKTASQNNFFDASVIILNTPQQSSRSISTSLNESNPVKEEKSVEVENLKDQLKKVNLEKSEITSKYEKLTVICRSQRQEIQELKCALAAFTRTSQSKDCSKSQVTPASLQFITSPEEKLDSNLLELEQAMLASSTAALPAPAAPPASVAPSQVPKPWQAFDDEPNAKPGPNNNFSGLPLPTNGGQSTWGFNQGNNDSAHSSQMPSAAAPSWGSSPQRFGSGLEKKLSPNQPSSWTCF